MDNKLKSKKLNKNGWVLVIIGGFGILGELVFGIYVADDFLVKAFMIFGVVCELSSVPFFYKSEKLKKVAE